MKLRDLRWWNTGVRCIRRTLFSLFAWIFTYLCVCPWKYLIQSFFIVLEIWLDPVVFQTTYDRLLSEFQGRAILNSHCIHQRRRVLSPLRAVDLATWTFLCHRTRQRESQCREVMWSIDAEINCADQHLAKAWEITASAECRTRGPASFPQSRYCSK